MTDELRRVRRRWCLALVAFAVLAPLALAAARWPSYWLWIASEQTPMTWLQSVVLVLAAATGLLVAVLLRLRQAVRRDRLPWLGLAVGFAGLAVDERFAVHERIRDGVLAPRGVSVPFLPWVAPGDFLVLMLGCAGLAFLPVVMRVLAPDPPARRLFVAGTLLAMVAVGVDSIDPSTWSLSAERLQQSLEEVVELAAGLCFWGAVTLRLLGLLMPPPGTPADEAPAVTEMSVQSEGAGSSAPGEKSPSLRG
jgi:hypothetical protein